jgi:cytochrome b subunit of formate dehydrogenase
MADVLDLEMPAAQPKPRDAGTAAPARPAAKYQQRFDRFDRTLHGFLMLSFLGLASTGMPLLFSDAPWAARMARLLGGFAFTHRLHRVFAAIMILVFLTHLLRLVERVAIRRDYSIFWGPRAMVPQPKDLAEMFQHFRWFVGLGPRPAFDRYTYWEKFDYWAVFWGMAIIGGSGLLLWFPEAFARIVPGWVFNIALLIHGEEALLAVGFIFTIHFFNGHLRPEKFPMDLVIFTGRVSELDLREERPAEYARLVAGAGVRDAGAPSRRSWMIGRLVGTTAVVIGLSIVGLIVYAMVSHG